MQFVPFISNAWLIFLNSFFLFIILKLCFIRVIFSLSLHFFFFLRILTRKMWKETSLLPIFILFSCAFPNYFARRENVLMHPHSCCTTDRETRLNSLNCKHPCHKSREICRTVLILVQALWWILVEKSLDYSIVKRLILFSCQFFFIIERWYFNDILLVLAEARNLLWTHFRN